MLPDGHGDPPALSAARDRDGSLLPAALERRVHAFVRDHRARAPGLLTAVIVTGSATLGDWRLGVSDIDLVLVTSRPPHERDVAAVRGLHAGSA